MSSSTSDPVSAKTGLGSHASVAPYAVPIDSRPASSTWVQTLTFAFVFNGCILASHVAQLLVWPLSLHPATYPIYRSVIAYTKLAFARILLIISQFFGPTQLIISFGDGKGGLLDPEQFVVRDKQSGCITRVELPQRAVWMSNHQVYTDWLYLWCLSYYADTADSILIILKKSLKWVPIVGWGMQFFRFIFLARNWASDQAQLSKHLGSIASENPTVSVPGQEEATRKTTTAQKLLLLIFPEGTLVSRQTRPISAKFAEKTGIKDLENVLLPRSTGLFFCLQTLAKEMHDLWLVDFTIGYPGIPPAGYGQDFYTLRSIFMQGVSPPAVHIHLTMTSVTPPTSNDTSKNAESVAHIQSAQVDVPPLGRNVDPATDDEKTAFQDWIMHRWVAKDQLMHRFYQQGDFVGGEFTKAVAQGQTIDPTQAHASAKFVVLPVKLRSLREIGDSVCWFIPYMFLWQVWNLVQYVLR